MTYCVYSNPLCRSLSLYCILAIHLHMSTTIGLTQDLETPTNTCTFCLDTISGNGRQITVHECGCRYYICTECDESPDYRLYSDANPHRCIFCRRQRLHSVTQTLPGASPSSPLQQMPSETLFSTQLDMRGAGVCTFAFFSGAAASLIVIMVHMGVRLFVIISYVFALWTIWFVWVILLARCTIYVCNTCCRWGRRCAGVWPEESGVEDAEHTTAGEITAIVINST